jgi:hypothetical protein
MLKNVRNSDLSLIKHQLDYNMWTLFSEFLAPDDKTRYLSDLILHTKQGYYFLIQAFAPYGTYRHFHAPLDTSAGLYVTKYNFHAFNLVALMCDQLLTHQVDMQLI